MPVKNTTRLLGVFGSLLLLTAAASAGPLPTDPNAITGFKGASSYLNGNLKGSIEFAVYAPGKFGTSVALGLPAKADPSAGTDYVYTYEIFNAGTESLTDLSVALIPFSIPVGSTRIGNDATTPELGVAPTINRFQPTTLYPKQSAFYLFATTPLGAGVHSDILLFTSPYGPTMIGSTVHGVLTTVVNNISLPTPIPEPATITLAICGLFGFAFEVWRRRR